MSVRSARRIDLWPENNMEKLLMKLAARRLISAVLILAITGAILFAMMYAWFTLSSAPEVGGFEITISVGGNIMIAPNKVYNVDGKTYNYPSNFSSSINFNLYSEYDYLKDIGILSPVSTADGIHWFIPDYYDAFDEDVINGVASAGQVKSIDDFTLDTYLEYANLTSEYSEKADKGSYVFLDFWVVSPIDNCELRVVSDDIDSGSFALEVKAPVENEDGSYTLEETSGDFASTVRLGFLVNTDYILDGSEDVYKDSTFYDPAYSKIKGAYQEKGNDKWYSDSYSFCVYEPNADLHPTIGVRAYYPTYPIAWDGKHAYVSGNSIENLTVQLENNWKEAEGAAIIDQKYEVALQKNSVMSPEAAKEVLYKDVLVEGAGGYVERGRFIKNVGGLSSFLNDGVVTEEEMTYVETTGATYDSCITILERNCPQRIRMFVWIEGQDVDCTALRGSLDIIMSLELAGSNQGLYEKTKQDNNR